MANPVSETISYQTHYALERRGEGGREWARVEAAGGREEPPRLLRGKQETGSCLILAWRLSPQLIVRSGVKKFPWEPAPSSAIVSQ